MCNEYLWAGILVITIFMELTAQKGKGGPARRQLHLPLQWVVLVPHCYAGSKYLTHNPRVSGVPYQGELQTWWCLIGPLWSVWDYYFFTLVCRFVTWHYRRKILALFVQTSFCTESPVSGRVLLADSGESALVMWHTCCGHMTVTSWGPRPLWSGPQLTGPMHCLQNFILWKKRWQLMMITTTLPSPLYQSSYICSLRVVCVIYHTLYCIRTFPQERIIIMCSWFPSVAQMGGCDW